MCSLCSAEQITFQTLNDVIFISLSKHHFFFFCFFLSCWHVGTKSSTQDECFGLETSASFSSAVESHRSCITSMLLAHPEGNSHLSEGGNCIALSFRWMGKSFTWIPSFHQPSPLTWSTWLLVFLTLKSREKFMKTTCKEEKCLWIRCPVWRHQISPLHISIYGLSLNLI